MAKNNKTNNQNHEGRGFALIAKAIREHASITKNPSDHELNQHKKNRRIGWAGVVVAAAYTAVSYWILTTTQDTLKEIKNQTPEIQKSATAAIVAVRASNRAWLEPRLDESFMPVDTSGRVEFRIQVINSGHSPAVHITSDTNVELLERTQAPRLTYPNTGSANSLGIVFPGTAGTPPFELHPTLLNSDNATVRVLNALGKQKLFKGEVYIVFYGRVGYSDEFGEHWTHFCWAHTGTGAIIHSRKCVDYNAVGDGEEPNKPTGHATPEYLPPK